MKHSVDTYRLYNDESIFSHVVRIFVNMKEPVDPDILWHSVNVAMKRYPYFAVRVTVDEEGAYVLQPNEEPVVVLPIGKKVPKAGSREVNGHLAFVTYQGRQINFYLSHSLSGGKGALPWVLTNVYQYVRDRYQVEPDAPGIRKPDSELLPGETAEPTVEMFSDQPPIYTYKNDNPVKLAGDYLNGMFNPFRRSPNYRLYTFRQKDIVNLAKSSGTSVAGIFLVLAARMLDRVLPEKHAVITGEIAHNPLAKLGLPYAHCDLLSHVYIDYDRETLKAGEMQKLGALTREMITLQTDPSVSNAELRRLYALNEKIDAIQGLKEKRKFVKENNLSSGKNAVHGTYIVNYSGQMDWGEVAEYVRSYGILVEGHVLMELTSMKNKIFLTFMQLLNQKKYADAFQGVLEELEIPYRVEGPYKKRLSKHELPKE